MNSENNQENKLGSCVSGDPSLNHLLSLLRHAETPTESDDACRAIHGYVDYLISSRISAFAAGCDHSSNHLHAQLQEARAKLAEYESKTEPASISSSAASIEDVQRERDTLATAIRDSAQDLGLVRSGASLSCSHLANLAREIGRNLRVAVSPVATYPYTTGALKDFERSLIEQAGVLDEYLIAQNAPGSLRNHLQTISNNLFSLRVHDGKTNRSVIVEEMQRGLSLILAFFKDVKNDRKAGEATTKLSAGVSDFYAMIMAR